MKSKLFLKSWRRTPHTGGAPPAAAPRRTQPGLPRARPQGAAIPGPSGLPSGICHRNGGPNWSGRRAAVQIRHFESHENDIKQTPHFFILRSVTRFPSQGRCKPTGRPAPAWHFLSSISTTRVTEAALPTDSRDARTASPAPGPKHCRQRADLGCSRAGAPLKAQEIGRAHV